MADGELATASASGTRRLGDIYRTINSPITYAVYIAPPGDGDYSLANFFGEDAPEAFPALAQRWADFLEECGVKRAFAPNTAFTADVGTSEQFKERIELPNGVPMFRNHIDQRTRKRIRLDGVMLEEPGDALVLAQGGCSTAVMVRGDRIGGARCGLDSLIHRPYVLTEVDRDRVSIIDTLAQTVCSQKTDELRQASCRAFGSLQLKDYAFPDDHPEHGRYNAKLATLLNGKYSAERRGILVRRAGRYLLDQGKLIEAQARRYKFNRVSTCLFPLKEKEFARTRHPDPAMRKKRNAFAIVRLT